MNLVLKWWLIFCLTLLSGGIATHFNLHITLYDADVTKLSFLILIVFFSTSIWIGRKTYSVGVLEDYDQTTMICKQSGWLCGRISLNEPRKIALNAKLLSLPNPP